MNQTASRSAQRLRDAFVDSGRRVTRQRAIVLDILEETSGHLHAEQVYELARKRDPSISLSTIYRTLAVLKEHDFVVERRLDQEYRHYETKDKSEHYHLICSSCGRVIEFDSASLYRLLRLAGGAQGYQVQRAEIEVTGRCAFCRRKAPPLTYRRETGIEPVRTHSPS